MIKYDTINRNAVHIHLIKARDAIVQLADEVQRGEHDDCGAVELGYKFGEILKELLLAWHSKWLGDDDLDALTDEEYDLMRTSVPRWYFNDMTLVELTEPAELDRRVEDD